MNNVEYHYNNNANIRQALHTVKFSARLTARIRLSETNRSLPNDNIVLLNDAKNSDHHNGKNQDKLNLKNIHQLTPTMTQTACYYYQYIPNFVIQQQSLDDVDRDNERTDILYQNLVESDNNINNDENNNNSNINNPPPQDISTINMQNTSLKQQYSPTSHHFVSQLLKFYNDIAPINLRHDHKPLFIDPLARYFGGSGAVSSLYDHTHFLYRKMVDNWTTFGPKIWKNLSKYAIFIFLLHYFESRRLSYHRQAMPYIQVRTRVYDDAITFWCQETNQNLTNDEEKVTMQGINISSSAPTTTTPPSVTGTSQKPPQSTRPQPPQLQLVSIGAGFDSRTMRLPALKNAVVYEIDQLEVLSYKESLFQLNSDTNSSSIPSETSNLGDSYANNVNVDCISAYTTPIQRLNDVVEQSSKPCLVESNASITPATTNNNDEKTSPIHCNCSICIMNQYQDQLPFYHNNDNTHNKINVENLEKNKNKIQTKNDDDDNENLNIHGVVEDKSTRMPTMWPPKQLCHSVNRVVGDIAMRTSSNQYALGIVQVSGNSNNSDVKTMADDDNNNGDVKNSNDRSIDANKDAKVEENHKKINHNNQQHPSIPSLSLTFAKSNTNRTRPFSDDTVSIPILPSFDLIRGIFSALVSIFNDTVILLENKLDDYFNQQSQNSHYQQHQQPLITINDIITNTITSINTSQPHIPSTLVQLFTQLYIHLVQQPLSLFPPREFSLPQLEIQPYINKITLYHLSYLIAIRLHHDFIAAGSVIHITQFHKDIDLFTSKFIDFYNSYTSILIKTNHSTSNKDKSFIDLNELMASINVSKLPPNNNLKERFNWVFGLLQTGFNPFIPTMFAIEGVIMYLPPHTVKETMLLVRDLCTFNPHSQLITDVYTSYAFLSNSSYYSLFKTGFSVHDKPWLFGNGVTSLMNGTGHVTSSNTTNSNNNVDTKSPNRANIDSNKNNVNLFKSANLSQEDTLMKFIKDCHFTQSKIGILKNQSYLDYRMDPLLLSSSNTSSVGTQTNVGEDQDDRGKADGEYLGGKIKLFNETENLSTHKILSPYRPNPNISHQRMSHHPLHYTIDPAGFYSNDVSNTKVDLDNNNKDHNNNNNNNKDKAQYRVNNTICYIPSVSNHIKSSANKNYDNNEIYHPICVNNYHDANYFFKSDLFLTKNYTECKYIFPHHTYSNSQQSITPFTVQADLKNDSDDDNNNSITNSKVLSLDDIISHQSPYSDIDIKNDCLTQLPPLNNFSPNNSGLCTNDTNHDSNNNNTNNINNNTSTSDLASEHSNSTNHLEHQKHNKQHHTDMHKLLQQYPPIFSLSYHSFWANSQHECEPALRYHVPNCNLFNKLRLQASKSILYNPFFLFDLYNISPFSENNNNMNNESDTGDLHNVNKRDDDQNLALIDKNNVERSPFVQLLNSVADTLIDIDMCHDLQPYMDHYSPKKSTNDGNNDNNNDQGKDDKSSEKVEKKLKGDPNNPHYLKHKQQQQNQDNQKSGKNIHKPQCKCLPCPDMVEYYIFIAKP